MSSLLSKPSVIIWPRYLQEFSILITVLFIITDVPGFISNFSGNIDVLAVNKETSLNFIVK